MKKKLKHKNHSLRIEVLELKEEIRRLKSENESLRKCYKISDNISGEDIETILANINIDRLEKECEELKRRLKEI